MAPKLVHSLRVDGKGRSSREDSQILSLGGSDVPSRRAGIQGNPFKRQSDQIKYVVLSGMSSSCSSSWRGLKEGGRSFGSFVCWILIVT